MRLLGPLIDLLAWRLRLAEAGVQLRLRSLMSFLIILGGLGAAAGFAMVGRLERMRRGPEDETHRSAE